jgi:hypothetical protein
LGQLVERLGPPEWIVDALGLGQCFLQCAEGFLELAPALAVTPIDIAAQYVR